MRGEDGDCRFHARRDLDQIPLREVDDLIVEAHPTGAVDDHVRLLLELVAMSVLLDLKYEDSWSIILR